MRYIKAIEENIEQIFELVQVTITTIYPKYYNREVVDFFLKHHSKDNIANDIRSGYVNILLIDDYLVGTGSYKDNHITRVFIRPSFQGQGYGSYIMERLEKEIALNYDVAYLDSSLPASSIYEHRGYKTIKHEKWLVGNDAVLVYEIMEKSLSTVATNINYNGNIIR